MRRIPLTLRALVLVPLLAVVTTRRAPRSLCGPRAESCLEAAGHGWYGAAGVLALVLYGAGLALGRRPARAGRAPGFRRLWAVGTGAVVGVVRRPGAARLALGAGAALGGGWLGLLALGVARRRRARARAAGRARRGALVRALRPAAPRLRLRRGRLAAARALVDGHAAPPGCA